MPSISRRNLPDWQPSPKGFGSSSRMTTGCWKRSCRCMTRFMPTVAGWWSTEADAMEAEMEPIQPSAVSLKDLSLYFLKLGALGFGGPIALAGYMQRDLQEERRWLTRDEFQDGLAIAQTMPGPLAAQ